MFDSLFEKHLIRLKRFQKHMGNKVRRKGFFCCLIIIVSLWVCVCVCEMRSLPFLSNMFPWVSKGKYFIFKIMHWYCCMCFFFTCSTFFVLPYFTVYMEYHKKVGFNFWLKDTSVVQIRRSTEALNHIIRLKDSHCYHYSNPPCHLHVQ